MIVATHNSTNSTALVSGVTATQSAPGGAAPTEAVGSLMSEPSGGDISMAIAQMVIKSAYDSRKRARTDRQQASTAMVAAQKAQISELKKEAEKRYEAAKSEAFGKIFEGAAGVAGGLVSSGLFSTKTDGATTAYQQARDSGLGSALTSSGKLASGGVGLIMTSGLRRESDLAGVAAKGYEMEATAQKRLIENAEDEIQEARDHVRKALDFLRDFQSTEAKSMSSAIRG
ncbi:MAG: hypothetical protein KF894_29150 [Labilithrix sp.]|nr:hypothetical protein [Labilithrix sp.]